MEPSRSRQIGIVLLIIFLFFCPLAFFTGKYHSKTNGSQSDGDFFQAGIHSIFPAGSHLNEPGMNVVEYSSVNLGIYATITMRIHYNKKVKGKAVVFDSGISYSFYGLGSAGIKKAYANESAIHLINAEALRMRDLMDRSAVKN